MNVNNIEKNKCTGCKMCGDICPCDAIEFIIDAEGFWYPSVNEDKCNNCGLCYRKCPALNFQRKDNNFPQVYSLWSKDENVRVNSTSGGVFWEFARFFIENDGIVVGARFGDDWRSAEHAIASSLEELTALRGSKYFQSDTADIYKKIRNLLEEGKRVLFCGTPCQNAALNSFLGKEYDNLVCMDFICRSINSPKAFKAYIDELEKTYNSRVIKVHLKNKKKGWQSLASQVLFESGEESLKDKDVDPWVRGFIYNDLYTRESCFYCNQRVIPRASADFTIGDFWGVKNQNDEDLFKGISVLLINSEKGKIIFDRVNDKFVFEECDYETVVPGNPALTTSPIPSQKKSEFFYQLNKGCTFSEAVEKCTKKSTFEHCIIKVKKIKNRVKYLKGLFIEKEISIFGFIYYNKFCKHIKRTGKGRILPHRNSVINFATGSTIVLGNKDLEIGFNKLKGSKAETHLRMDKNAKWDCKNGALLFYNTVLEIKENARFSSGFFSMNGGSVIIIHTNMEFGEDVMIGRNVVIYDSDFHSINDRKGNPSNPAKPVKIEDHVWLTTNIMVQKGVTIGKDSLIAAYTVVNKDVPPHSIVAGKCSGEVIKDWVSWDRDICPL